MTDTDPTIVELRFAAVPLASAADALAALCDDNTRRLLAITRACDALAGRLSADQAAAVLAAYARLTVPVAVGDSLLDLGLLCEFQQRVLARRLGELEAVLAETAPGVRAEDLP